MSQYYSDVGNKDFTYHYKVILSIHKDSDLSYVFVEQCFVIYKKNLEMPVKFTINLHLLYLFIIYIFIFNTFCTKIYVQ